jgi:GT2 family glycosyltransferase
MYFSDSDFCIRADRAGFTTWLTPLAVIRHENHASTSEFHTLRKRDRTFLIDQWVFEYYHGQGILEYMSCP